MRIAQQSTGFLYYVSVAGITGERDRLPEELAGQLRWLHGQTDLPICVGFGISKPEHMRMLREVADGVIVGSALVRRLELVGERSLEEVIREITALTAALAGALRTLLEDQDLRHRIGAANGAKARAVFDEARMFARYGELFDGELRH